MRGSYTFPPLEGSLNWGQAGLILLYALAFYFGPQIGGSGLGGETLHQGAHASTGGASGYFWPNGFTDPFDINTYN